MSKQQRRKHDATISAKAKMLAKTTKVSQVQPRNRTVIQDQELGLRSQLRADPLLEAELVRIRDSGHPDLVEALQILKQEQAAKYVDFVNRQLDRRLPVQFFFRVLEWTRDPHAIAQLHLQDNNDDRHLELDVQHVNIYIKTPPVGGNGYEREKCWRTFVNNEGQNVGVMVWWRNSHLKKHMMVSEGTIGPRDFGIQMAELMIRPHLGIMLLAENFAKYDQNKPIIVFPDANIVCDADLLKIVREGARRSGDTERADSYTRQLMDWKHPLGRLQTEQQRRYAQNRTEQMKQLDAVHRWQEIRAHIEKINKVIDRDVQVLKPLAMAINALFPESTTHMTTPLVQESSDPSEALVQQLEKQVRASDDQGLTQEEVRRRAIHMARMHVGDVRQEELLALRRERLERQMALEIEQQRMCRDMLADAETTHYELEQNMDLSTRAYVALAEYYTDRGNTVLRGKALRCVEAAGMPASLVDWTSTVEGVPDLTADASAEAVEAWHAERERRRTNPVNALPESHPFWAYQRAKDEFMGARKMADACVARIAILRAELMGLSA